MGQANIPVDLFNPGQVFACLGFLEVANLLFGDARGGFDWHSTGKEQFLLRTDEEQDPIVAVLRCLQTARVTSLAPTNTDLATEKWDVATRLQHTDAPYPIDIPSSPATLPAVLECRLDERKLEIVINHWGDPTTRDAVKFWAGAGGYPGAALLRDALELVREELPSAAHDPFAVAKPQSSSFRFDWRRDYIPLDSGFSPNDHGNLTMIGFPLVEILAAIGLTNARPKRSSHSKLEYHYGVIAGATADELLDPIFIRAALGGTDLGFAQRNFHMLLGWPGQENQARCITNVIEETKG